MKRIRAQIISLGGGVLLAIALLLAALLLVAFMLSSVSRFESIFLLFLTGACLLYFVDSLTEVMMFDQGVLIFDSLLKRRRRVDLSMIHEILFIHEGLNLEHGIESLIFRRSDGDVVARFDLGPLWRRSALESFLHEVERTLGRTKLLQEVR
jgi:hypothetical protein